MKRTGWRCPVEATSHGQNSYVSDMDSWLFLFYNFEISPLFMFTTETGGGMQIIFDARGRKCTTTFTTWSYHRDSQMGALCIGCKNLTFFLPVKYTYNNTLCSQWNCLRIKLCLAFLFPTFKVIHQCIHCVPKTPFPFSLTTSIMIAIFSNPIHVRS